MRSYYYARRQFLLRGEETGSTKGKGKEPPVRSFRAFAPSLTAVPELQRTVEQLNAELAEFSAPQVELPKVKSKMKNWEVQHGR